MGSSSSGGNIGFFPVGCGVYDAIYFVSNNGSDENGDGSINNPYFSIQTTIDIANDFDTVKVTTVSIWKTYICQKELH